MAGGRLFSYFTRSMGEGRGEKEPSSLPINVTSQSVSRRVLARGGGCRAGQARPSQFTSPPAGSTHQGSRAEINTAPAATACRSGSGHLWVVCGCTQAALSRWGQRCHRALPLCCSALLCPQHKPRAGFGSFICSSTANAFSMAPISAGPGWLLRAVAQSAATTRSCFLGSVSVSGWLCPPGQVSGGVNFRGQITEWFGWKEP